MTFSDQQTLPNPGPTLVTAGEFGGRVIMTFDPTINYGDVADEDAWTVTRLGVPFNITSIQVQPAFVIVFYTTLGLVADQIEFVGPPPIFRDVDDGILRSFASVVPFP